MAEYLELERVLDDKNIITVQTKEYGSIDVIPVDTITDIELSDVQLVKHGRWIGIHEYCKKNGYIPSGIGAYYWCSECEKAEPKISDYCPNCGARMDSNKDKDNNVGHLTDEETAIYESWIESEAKDTGENIMDGDTE